MGPICWAASPMGPIQGQRPWGPIRGRYRHWVPCEGPAVPQGCVMGRADWVPSGRPQGATTHVPAEALALVTCLTPPGRHAGEAKGNKTQIILALAGPSRIKDILHTGHAIYVASPSDFLLGSTRRAATSGDFRNASPICRG